MIGVCIRSKPSQSGSSQKNVVSNETGVLANDGGDDGLSCGYYVSVSNKSAAYYTMSYLGL
jgi:hypothetical protein